MQVGDCAAMTSIAVADQRAHLVVDEHLVDVGAASDGHLGPDPMALWARMDEIRELAATVALAGDEPAVADVTLSCPVPSPSQVFGVGLNYRSHATETGMELPGAPMVFTKFASSLAGPQADIPVTGPAIDWEVELVVVVGTGGRDIAAADALDHVAGFTVGQDVSDRILQLQGERPQFSLAKSRRNHSPIGPVVVDRHDVEDPGDLELWCELDGERVQHARTSDLIFGVPELVEYLSGIVELRPGDLVFTGTPSGVGASRDPVRFLRPGETLVSAIGGIGRLVNRCVAP